jgi:hypothetical protein
VPNKATRAMKEIAASLTINNAKYMRTLRKRLESGKIHPSVETFVLAHAVGKPVERIDMTTQEIPALVIDRVSTRAEMIAAIGGQDTDAGDPDDDD